MARVKGDYIIFCWCCKARSQEKVWKESGLPCTAATSYDTGFLNKLRMYDER